MPEPVAIPFRFDQGIYSKHSVSVMPEGSMQASRNYEPLPNGGLGIRRPWGNWSTSGQPASGKRAARGMNADFVDAGIRYLVLALDDAVDSMDLYETTHGVSAALTSIENVAVSSRLYPVKFAAAEGRLYHSHPGYPDGNVRWWDGTTTGVISAFDLIAGASLTYHLNRLWTGGGATEPSRIYFSSIGDAATWNLTEGFLDVGKDDGGEVRETCVFDRTLLIGKENGLWLLGGSTLDTFQLYPLNRFLPVARGRSMLPTERGVFIVNEQGVWLWDGASFDEITRPLDFSLSGNYATLAYADGKLFVQDQGAAYTWVTDGRRWWQEDSEADDAGEVYGWNRYLYAGMKAASTVPIMFRQEPGTVRGGAEVGGIIYDATSCLRWIGPPNHGKVTLRKLWIRYRQRGATGSVATTVHVNSDMGQQASFNLEATGVTPGFTQKGGLRDAVGEVNLIGNAFSIRFLQDLSGTQTCHIEIEEVEGEVLMDPRNRP